MFLRYTCSAVTVFIAQIYTGSIRKVQSLWAERKLKGKRCYTEYMPLVVSVLADKDRLEWWPLEGIIGIDYLKKRGGRTCPKRGGAEYKKFGTRWRKSFVLREDYPSFHQDLTERLP
jgi:hypothetical protein